MKTKLLSLKGEAKKEVELPSVFNEEHRPDIIKRAFLAETSRLYQPYGTNPLSGMRTSAENWHTGAGRARIPRVKAGPHRAGRNAKGHVYRSKGRWFHAAGKAAIRPGTVGGRAAHPPKAEEVILKNINKKEYRKALRSAVAATADKNLVTKRGHKLNEKTTYPLVVEDAFIKLTKTKEILDALIALNFGDELKRTSTRKIRAGIGKMRSRRYVKKVGPLIVTGKNEGTDVFKKASINIPGVTVSSVNELNIKELAPGANSGRLCIWTESALDLVEKRLSGGSDK